jgi:hypothetical protein
MIGSDHMQSIGAANAPEVDFINMLCRVVVRRTVFYVYAPFVLGRVGVGPTNSWRREVPGFWSR